MYKMVLFTTGFAVVVGSTLTVNGQPPRGPERGGERGSMVDRLLSYDENEDGKLSEDEVPERLSGLFSRADQNDDGSLTRDEIVAHFRDREGRPDGEGSRRPEGDRGRRGGDGPPFGGGRGRGPGMDRGPGRGPGDGPGRMPPNPFMGALDTDRDGEISAEELKNATAALAKLDRNGDGRIDHAELTPPEHRDRDGRRGDGPREEGRRGDGPRGEGRRGDGPPPRDGDRPRGRGPGDGNMADFLLNRFDDNGDGKLSGDEIPERMANNFDQIDTNNDDAIDRAEIEQMARQFQGRRSGRPGGRPDGEDRPRRRPPVEE